MIEEQMKKIVLENQIDAVSRCKYLLDQKLPKSQYSIEEIIFRLAEAERKSQIFCGFEALNKSLNVIKEIKTYMEQQQYITTDNNGKLNLTEKGLIRAKNKLPSEIEQYLYQ